MLLKQNDSKIEFYCMINLYFEGGKEKHIQISKGDKVKITYRNNGDKSIESGIIKDIIPINITTDGNCSFGCSCDCGCKSSGMILLDTSKEFDSSVEKILIGNILDIEKIDTGLLATPDDINDIINNAKEGDTILLSSGIYGDINIDKSIKIRGKEKENPVLCGNINVTGKDVEISNCNILLNNAYKIEVLSEGDFTFTDNAIVSISESIIRTFMNINAKGKVTIDNNIFDGDKSVYNWIEISINKNYPLAEGSSISGNSFCGNISHNNISIYTFAESSTIRISNNKVQYSSNAVRISNTTSVKANIIMADNLYINTDETDNYKYAGFLFFQDFSPKGEVMDFSKITLYIDKLTGPNGKSMLKNIPNTIDQIYYVYDDQEGILVDRNQPLITIA